MLNDVCGGLMCCWLLPLALLGGVVLVARAIAVAWRNRGLERGAVYCAGCRFNLKGCASWNCPECGAHLDEGRVMTAGDDRPLGLVPRMMLAAAASLGPMVLGGVLLATVFPVNYETRRELELRPATEAVLTQSQIDIRGNGEVAWWGRGKPRSILLRVARKHQHSHGHMTSFPWYDPRLPQADNLVLTDQEWAELVELCGMSEETQAWRDAARAELVLALRYMAGEFGSERPVFARFHVQERQHSYFEPNGVFVLLEVGLGLVVLALVLRWVVLWHLRVMDVHTGRHRRLAEQVTEWIARNREKAGLGKE